MNKEFNSKKAIMGTPLILLVTAIFILVIVILFFFLIGLKTGKTPGDVKGLIGNNLFAIGILRAESDINGEKMTVSEMISAYQIKKEAKYSSKIKTEIDRLIFEMYQKKICWKLTTPKGVIKQDDSDCVIIAIKDQISSKITIAGFNQESFDITFETKKSLI